MNDREISTIEWAMKDAMRTESIAFKKWCDENEDMINMQEEYTHTPEELYDIFKKENP